MSPFSWRGRPHLAWLLAVAFLLALDQLSKAWFASTIALGTAVEVTTWFNLVHVLNTGAAFSLLAEAGGWQRVFFIVVGVMVVVPITFVCLARQVEPLERTAGALLLAGGSGNLIDRISSGAVTDFLDLHWRGLHWPAFNLADVFIVLAAKCASFRCSPTQRACRTWVSPWTSWSRRCAGFRPTPQGDFWSSTGAST